MCWCRPFYKGECSCPLVEILVILPMLNLSRLPVISTLCHKCYNSDQGWRMDIPKPLTSAFISSVCSMSHVEFLTKCRDLPFWHLNSGLQENVHILKFQTLMWRELIQTKYRKWRKTKSCSPNFNQTRLPTHFDSQISHQLCAQLTTLANYSIVWHGRKQAIDLFQTAWQRAHHLWWTPAPLHSPKEFSQNHLLLQD